MSKSKILIIIPCFNEQESISNLLYEISEVIDNNCEFNISIIVIDDGSSDLTYSIAFKLNYTIRILKNLGIGGAVQTGFKFALENDFDFCIQIDGDGQHPPTEIIKLLNFYKQEPSSILIGSRYLADEGFKSTFFRMYGTKAISLIINLFYSQVKITDTTSGLRLLDRKAIKLFASSYPHDYPEPISIAWALKANLKITECAVLMRPRKHGNTSISGYKVISYMIRVISYIILSFIFV
jgi:glycosyltransferase involved in cell wall biosynthesis